MSIEYSDMCAHDRVNGGVYNACMGEGAGSKIVDGSFNILFGENAGINIVHGCGNFIFGDNILGKEGSCQFIVGTSICTRYLCDVTFNQRLERCINHITNYWDVYINSGFYTKEKLDEIVALLESKHQ